MFNKIKLNLIPKLADLKFNLIFMVLIILSVILISGCRKKNHPPLTPYTPYGSASGFIQTNLFFTSLAIDPDEDSVAIRFNWEYGDTSDWSSWLANEETASTSLSWFFPDTYFVKTQAKDKKEAYSAWSLPHCITIAVPESNQPPNTPSILSGPETGYVDTKYQFLVSAIDPEDNYIAFRFDWDDYNNSDWTEWLRSGDSVWVSHQWEYPSSYYLKAQAKDVGGLISEWSEVHQIIITHSGMPK